MDVVDARVQRILRAAASAPSAYNTQPWQVEVSGSRVTLRADTARQLRHSDPHGREMLIGCGAFLFNARTAARRESLTAAVTVLPDPDDELLVAVLELEPGPAPNTDELELSVAIARRATSRTPFDDQPLFTDVLMAIRAAAQEEGADLRPVQPSEPGREDGIPQDLLGPAATDDRAPVRRFHASRGSAQFEQRTTIAVLSTPGDSARDWIRAGEALQHVLLVATTYFVHASFATTVLENPTTRHDLREALSLDAAPQMLMRLGYSSMPQHTPRRSLPQMTRTSDVR